MHGSGDMSNHICDDYPWTASPLIVSAPMAKVAMPKLAVTVSKAGGLGFIATGYHSDHLEDLLKEAEDLLQADSAVTPVEVEKGIPKFLPVGVGYCPTAVWLFAPPKGFKDLIPWATKIREATASRTKIWVQIGCVSDAVEIVEAIGPDVIVVQGIDAEIHDRLREIRPIPKTQPHVLASGGISDCRAVAASIALGAQGCVLGTRFLASPESMIARGYQTAIVNASDGGVSTVRTTIYDKVRDIHGWPDGYDGRGLINKTFIDHLSGLSEIKNRELYREELSRGDEGYGPNGKLTTYAGTGVGLIREAVSAWHIVKSLREGAGEILGRQHRSKL